MWRRKKTHDPPPPSSLEATAARIRAQQDLERRLDDTTRVRALLEEWRRVRERNGIREAIENDLRRRA